MYTMKRTIFVPLAALTVLIGTGMASAQVFGGGRGLPGSGHGDVVVEIYSDDPASGAEPIETLILSRPLSPGEVIANYEGASFMIVSGEDFSRTIDLSELAVEVQIYPADPASGAEAIIETTLPDGSGVRALVADTEGAAFVVITGDDFTRTIDLSRPGAVVRFGGPGDVEPGRFEHRFPGDRRPGGRPGHR